MLCAQVDLSPYGPHDYRVSRPPTVDQVKVSVLRGMAEGLSDREIAHRMHVSVRTVQRVIDNFRKSSGASTRFAAGVLACRLGLLDD